MKVFRYVGFSVLAIAFIVGGLMSCDVIPKQRFESLPQWLRITLLICLIVSAIFTVWGIIEDYRQIRRGRRAEENDSHG